MRSSENGLAVRLRRDWAGIADRPAPVLFGYAEREPVLLGCRTPREVLDRVRPDPDALLAALIGLSQTPVDDDPDGPALADRIVLEAMTPKLIRMARRDPVADLDDYLTQLWLRVRTYPLVRRPTRIAANLVLDTLKAVRAEHHRDDRAEHLPAGTLPGWVTGGSGPAAPSAADVIRGASDLGLIDSTTRVILDAVYTEGRSRREVAETLQLSHATVRFRCSRAVRTLAGRAGDLAAA